MKNLKYLVVAAVALLMLSGCDVLTDLASVVSTTHGITYAEPYGNTPDAPASTASTEAAPTPSPTPEATEAPAEDPIMGGFDGNVYTNEYFGMTIEIPEDWHLQSTEPESASDSVDAGGVSRMAYKPAKARTQYEAVTSILFHVSKYETVGKPGPDIVLVVEGIGDLDISPAAYCKSTIQYFDDREGFTFGKVKEEKLAGLKFATATATIKMGDVKYNQILHSTIRNGYAMTFFLTSFNSSNLKELNAILKTLKFGE